MNTRGLLIAALNKKKAPDPSPEHEAMETPAMEKREHETGEEAMDEPVSASAAADLHSKLSSHFHGLNVPTFDREKDKKPPKGLALDKLDLGMTDHKKAAGHLRMLANHLEKRGKK